MSVQDEVDLFKSWADKHGHKAAINRVIMREWCSRQDCVFNNVCARGNKARTLQIEALPEGAVSIARALVSEVDFSARCGSYCTVDNDMPPNGRVVFVKRGE